MKILLVAGARPNFVKIAPILNEITNHPSLEPVLVHTGQHYDAALSDRFFSDLGIREPDVKLGVGSGSHAIQTAEVLKRIEPVLEELRPDLVLVVGDVNSTLAAALAAVKLGIPVAHVEAGLRSHDRTMPEEINRLLVDSIAEQLFVTEESGCQNLLREGISADRIHFVGNVMIDALEACRQQWTRSDIRPRLGLGPRSDYAVLTLHRPSNVDSEATLSQMLQSLSVLARELPIIFPVHPRVRAQLESRRDLVWQKPGLTGDLPSSGIICVEPLGYLDCIALMSEARMVLTDSGGIQEETTILNVPCLTLRETTERPVTVSHGTNRVIGTDPTRIVHEGMRALRSPPFKRTPPPLWDGQAAARIVKILIRTMGARAQSEDVSVAHAGAREAELKPRNTPIRRATA
ncbi:MAG TPA: UDP-N-acetylglucosamine 2-epimerase (non-hydrolyzing) [Patescibacteria group bacterium]|jgi:UDP-N-acetylglucosamine 2-epimerase (non-hydrolysing)|nr:UDP-N-acetylglucosamine 2-epimerase (non-hydrolyzing) [Patescibacteria group bacterium]